MFQLLIAIFFCFSLSADIAEDLQWKWALHSLLNFPLSLHDKVLDVGCGEGKITALLADKTAGVVVGLDVSKKMIDRASSNLKNSNLLFIQEDALSLPFEGQFDKVVSFCALHWILDQVDALQSMKDALKTDGEMLIVVPAKAENCLTLIAEKIASKEKWEPYFPTFKQERVYYTVEEYIDLINEAELELVSITTTDSITIYPNKTALIDWLKPLVNFVDHLSFEKQKEFMEEIAEEMLLIDPPLPDGQIELHCLKMEVIAKKIH